MKKRFENIYENIAEFFYSIRLSLHFMYQTKIYPLKAEHHWCKFYSWRDKAEREGWYVLDKDGHMIPWVHYDRNRVICLYSDMITPIKK